MVTMNKLIQFSLLCCGTFIALMAMHSASARDYIPPPNGPYQSSVVINNSIVDGEQQQVYKFPPADILIDEKPEPGSDFVSQSEGQRRDSQGPLAGPGADNQADLQQPQSMMTGPQFQRAPEDYYQWQAPQGNSYNAMQRWGNYQGAAPNYNPNVWQQNPQYGYPQQYPYSYGTPNQYNGVNNPFYGMPSPWNVMPKNPFFSDK